MVESQASRLKTLLEARLPEVVATRLNSARDQVGTYRLFLYMVVSLL